MNKNDNTAIIVNRGGVEKGAKLSNELTANEHVPQAHKISLKNIDKDEEVIRYGEVIGLARKKIEKGSWIKDSSMNLPIPPNLDSLNEFAKVTPLTPANEEYTFSGYRNADGTVGIKNILGITTSVQCVKGVVEFAVKKIKEELLPYYKNVDDVVPITHNYGCGVAINAEDAKIAIRIVKNLS